MPTDPSPPDTPTPGLPLPAAAELQAHLRVASKDRDRARKTPAMHSILAVDDSASMRQRVSFTLENAGFLVTEAVDGQDAWEKAEGKEFSLVLTDQNMPRMDGIALTKKLRESARFRNTPTLILTTESSDPMNQAGRVAGATGWRVKPFDPAKLVEVIGKVIR